MKKLMVTTAALALAGSVLAGAITSANIVGYTIKKPTTTGFLTITPCFSAVGESATGYSIQNIKAVSGFGGEGSEGIQILDKKGSMAEQYVYYSEDMAAVLGYEDGAGWYDDNGFATREISNGEAFFLESQTIVEVQCAGQVSFTGGTAEIAEAGFIWLGNSAPVQMSIQKFTPVSGFGGEGSEDIQILDNKGSMAEQYVYYSEDMAAALGYEDGAGWYNDAGYATRVLEPAEGFILEVGGAAEVNVPAATKPTEE